MPDDASAIDALLDETRIFTPDPAFTEQANASDPEVYQRARKDPESFWALCALELDWFQTWSKVLEWNPPFAKWFVGGKLNACYNCVDRHVLAGKWNKPAILWEGEPGDVVTLTYAELQDQTARFGNVLRKLGVSKGDRVAIYMPMIPELAIALLACARIGAVHSVIFGGFSADSLRERINDCKAKILITADGGWRRGQVISLKTAADEAIAGTPTIQSLVTVRRIGEAVNITMQEGRDYWWHELMRDSDPECPPEEMDSEDPLFILYTSGSTGKPKGIYHTTGGYLTGVCITAKWVFDLKDSDIYWCTADIGWVTGHSYIVYGPLANGATCVMYEGSPDTPSKDRFWRIIEKWKVTIFYTAPTAIRTFMRWGESLPAGCNLDSLRLLGSVGEPINPEAWMWYHTHIGKEKCPVLDTWWQTETGHIMIAPLPGITPTKPGAATRPLPGIDVAVINDSGEEVPLGSGGYLVIKSPWPGMLRTLWGDDIRYRQVYWSRFPDLYFTGDGARVDEDGYFWLLGRVDDVMLVAGHNLSAMEMESALVEHEAVAEAAVIGRHDAIKGQAPVAFVTLCEGIRATPELGDELKAYVGKKLGSICKPDEVLFSAELPKTRSGKIMRRLLRDIAEGRMLGDTTTLADPAVISNLKRRYTEGEG